MPQTAELMAGTAGVGERVDQMAPQGSFLFKCLRGLQSLSPHPRMGGIPGHHPRNPVWKGEGAKAVPPPGAAEDHLTVTVTELFPTPHSPKKGAHLKERVPACRQLKEVLSDGRGSPGVGGTAGGLSFVERTQLCY